MPKPDWSAIHMSEEVFWQIIDLFDWSKDGYGDGVIEPAVAALAQMRVDGIEQFADILAEKLYCLDSQAIAREIGTKAYGAGQTFSAHWFLFARCAVVASGRDVYETVLADPVQMPKDAVFESLLSVASTAYQRRTGREFDHVSPYCYETFSNFDGWPDEEG